MPEFILRDVTVGKSFQLETRDDAGCQPPG